MNVKTGYSGLQIGLHWIIAVLVGIQILFGESMTTVVDAAEENSPVSAFDQFMGGAHYWVGLSILGLVIVRLVVRLTQGAPQPASDLGAFALVAKVAHWAFYALLAAMPVTGLLAIYVNGDFGDIHSYGKPIFIVLIAAHALAALYHQFWLKDDTLRRILVPAD